MGRRIIRRRRPKTPRRAAVRRQVESSAPAPVRAAAEPEGSPILVATTGAVRNVVLPKLATIPGVSISGIADSPENALKMLIQDHPDVVLIDMDFGGPFSGLDIAKTMQKTRSQSAIIMLVSELDPVELHDKSRRFGMSWSYMKRAKVSKADILEVVLKSASRGVHWVEPELSRPLSELWKVAAQARDLEARQGEMVPVSLKPSQARRTAPVADPVPDEPAVASEVEEMSEFPEEFEETAGDSEDEVAPGIKLKTTNDAETDGLNITSVAIGHGGIGQNVGQVRRAG